MLGEIWMTGIRAVQQLFLRVVGLRLWPFHSCWARQWLGYGKQSMTRDHLFCYVGIDLLTEFVLALTCTGTGMGCQVGS